LVLELISSYPGEEVELRFGFLMKENRRENTLVKHCKEVQECFSKISYDKLNICG